MGSMTDLRSILREGETWLMQHVHQSLTEQGEAQYLSALEEVWHLSLQGLTETLIALLEAEEPMHTGPKSTAPDPSAAFGELEAKRHRTRGVPLEIILGLFKFYRRAYLALVRERGGRSSKARAALQRLDRGFDRIELSFCAAWVREAETGSVKDLQERNLELGLELERYINIFESLPVPILLLDSDRSVRNVNHAATQLFLGDHPPGAWYYRSGEKPSSAFLTDLFPGFHTELDAFLGSKEGRRECQWTSAPKGVATTFRVILSRMLDLPHHFAGTLVILDDLTERMQVAQERERLIGELTTALADVRQLTGLLPICSWCKKIRDDQGYWGQIESYLSSHSGVVFSHGVCPECAQKFRSERNG
jgi:PAS domain-containing protein